MSRSEYRPPGPVIYSAACTGNARNCLYPDQHVITDAESLRAAVAHDYTGALFRDNYRSLENFTSTNCLIPDCDNDHSDDPADWFTPEMLRKALPDVMMGIHFSRNHMRQKGSYSPRPRFHAIIYLGDCSSTDEYNVLRAKLQALFPHFDAKAMDAARFLFGTEEPDVQFFPGDFSFREFLDKYEAEHGEIQTAEEMMPPMENDGCAIIPVGRRNSELHSYAVTVLKRLGDCSEAKALFLKRAAQCAQPLPQAELDSIWRSALKFLAKIQSDPNYVPPAEYAKADEFEGLLAEPPIPFDEVELPPFPVEALPVRARSYVEAVAEATQTPVDMAATAALAVLASCTQGRYVVQAKPDWVEPTNLYALAIAEPSERKSAVNAHMTRAVHEFERKYNIENAGAVEASRMRHRILEKRQKAVEDQIAKGKAEEKEIAAIAQELAEFKERTPIQHYSDDVTPEKLVSIMAAHNGAAAIISAEGGIFDQLSGGMYSKSVNIDVFLKGHAGDAIRIDRIGRDSERVEHPALTMLLAAQPSVLAGIMQNDTFRSRGLTARFLYTIPKSYVGARRYRTEPIPPKASCQYRDLIFDLLDEDGNPKVGNPEVITLSPEADTMLEAFANEVEPKLCGEYADLADWAGKLCGTVVRIAGILCRADAKRTALFLGDAPAALGISGKIMADAIAIGKYYTEHAKAAYQLMGADPMIRQCKYVLAAIQNTGVVELTKRDIMRLCRSFKTADELQPVLDHLCERGYLAPKAEHSQNGPGRRASQTYLVNLALYAA